jgi:hypothetical protein
MPSHACGVSREAATLSCKSPVAVACGGGAGKAVEADEADGTSSGSAGVRAADGGVGGSTRVNGTRVNGACTEATAEGASGDGGLELCCRSNEVLAPILSGVLRELAVNGPPQSGAWGLDESSFSCKQRGCSADGASSLVVATKAGGSTRVNGACTGVTEDGASGGDGLELGSRSNEVLAPILSGVLRELAVNGPPQSGAWGLDESSFSCKQRGCSADGASSLVVATKAGGSTRVNGACTKVTAEGASGDDGLELADRSNGGWCAGVSTGVNGACTKVTAEGASGDDGLELADRSNATSSSRRRGGSTEGASSRVVAAGCVPSKQSALCSSDEDL